MKKVAVVIPCHNEQSTVGRVIQDFRRELPEADIYVCDNASTDDTAAVAREAGAVLLRQPLKGKGNAMRTLFESVDADIYVMVDGDDTYNAADAAQMIGKVEAGADMVVADRLSTTYRSVNSRRFHSQGNRLTSRIINLIFNSHVTDIMSGYRALSRRFVDNFPALSNGFEIETEMTVHALNYNFTVEQISSRYKERPEGSVSKLNTFGDGFRVLATIFRLFRDYRPLAFFSLFSLLFLIVAIALFIPVFAEYLSTGLVPRFPTLIVSGFILLLSILSFATGLILDAMARRQRFMFTLSMLHYDRPRPASPDKNS